MFASILHSSDGKGGDGHGEGYSGSVLYLPFHFAKRYFEEGF